LSAGRAARARRVIERCPGRAPCRCRTGVGCRRFPLFIPGR
jgi:hypothetical protein